MSSNHIGHDTHHERDPGERNPRDRIPAQGEGDVAGQEGYKAHGKDDLRASQAIRDPRQHHEPEDCGREEQHTSTSGVEQNIEHRTHRHLQFRGHDNRYAKRHRSPAPGLTHNHSLATDCTQRCLDRVAHSESLSVTLTQTSPVITDGDLKHA